MDRATATTLLANKVAASSRPALEPADLLALLALYATADSSGRLPSDEGWVGTWNLNAAAAEGWRWKAGKVAGDFTFSADDGTYNKAQVLAHCEAMAAQFAALDTSTYATVETGYGSPRLVL